jgi:hypothetical protein
MTDETQSSKTPNTPVECTTIRNKLETPITVVSNTERILIPSFGFEETALERDFKIGHSGVCIAYDFKAYRLDDCLYILGLKGLNWWEDGV